MLNPDGTKTCPACKIPLPTDSFYKTSRKIGDGFGGYCKACTKNSVIAWQKANPEKLKATQVRTAKKRSELYKAGLILPARTERKKARDAQWCADNPEKVAEYQKRYRQNKRGRDLNYYRAESALSSGRARAKKKNTPSDMGMEDWDLLRKVFPGCAYCGSTPKLVDLDHVVPIHRGGYNVVGNIVPTCRICNSHKGCQDPREFAVEIGIDLREIMTKARVRTSEYPTDDGTLLSSGTAT